MTEQDKEFWAHSDPDGKRPGETGARWQNLREHLLQVAALAKEFALAAGGDAEFSKRAEAVGLLHDLGKYRTDFQKMLKGEIRKAPHSIYGAAAAQVKARATDVAFAIAGHHSGLPDKVDLKSRIMTAKNEAIALWEKALHDLPQLAFCVEGQNALLGPLTIPDAIALDMQCRMLLSCLVDADRLDTARHYGEDLPPSHKLNAQSTLARLLAYVERKARNVEEGAVKQARAMVLGDCLEAASRSGNLFTLTVPTGGGKTLSAMAFALQRAVHLPRIRRVIVVIPYLSIIEQNADVYRESLGLEILEHHSSALGMEAGDGVYTNPTRRIAIENWDAPVVVTTSVRFFETLFSNHPRDLRRLHNIAQSVVILDEVQTLPRCYLEATLSVIHELSERWGTTFVFSTATQPALERHDHKPQDPRWKSGTTQEITRDVPRLFSLLRRVKTDWRHEPMNWDEVAAEVTKEPQALIILNTRKNARDLTGACQQAGRMVIHLSTNLCPAHRRNRLAEIRAQLKEGNHCLVVATQLVEAGVDIDFPVVWRAMGPMDAIAQAAGRCDREGKLSRALGKPGGRLVVFQPLNGGMPKGVYQQGADIATNLFRAGQTDWENPVQIREYFNSLYGDGPSLDLHEIQRLRKESNFAQVANEVNWIEDDGHSILVPYGDEARQLIRQFTFAEAVSLRMYREAQRFTVTLREGDFQRARALGSVREVRPEVWVCQEGLYDDVWGISIEGTETIV